MLSSEFYNGFKPQSLADWKAQFEKDLKGKVDPDNLGFTDVDDFFMPAFQNGETVGDIAYLQNFAQFLAASKKPGWSYAETIWYTTETETNAALKAAAAGGAEAILLYIEEADIINPGKLLNGISLKEIGVHFVIGSGAGTILYALNQYYPGMGSIKGSLNFLPANEQIPEKAFWKEYSELLKAFPNTFKFKPWVVSGAMVHEAGASTVQEIACVIAQLADTFEQLELTGIPLAKSAKMLQIQVPVTQKYLIEIAKLRAIQLLANKVLAVNGLEQIAIPIQTTGSARVYTPQDPDSNILRNTAMLLAATAGGAEVVSVLPHNTSDAEFGLRIARNISHLLVQEGYTNTTIEMAKGSWYLDELTHKLATAAWDLFLNIECKGGYFACLGNGFIAELCQDSAEKRATAYAEGKEVLIGANAYPLPNPLANAELPWTIHSTSRVLTPTYLAY